MLMSTARYQGLAMIAGAVLVTIFFIIMPIERAFAGDMNASVGIRPFFVTAVLTVVGGFYVACGAQMQTIMTDPAEKSRKIGILVMIMLLSMGLALTAFFLVTSSVDAALFRAYR